MNKKNPSPLFPSLLKSTDLSWVREMDREKGTLFVHTHLMQQLLPIYPSVNQRKSSRRKLNYRKFNWFKKYSHKSKRLFNIGHGFDSCYCNKLCLVAILFHSTSDVSSTYFSSLLHSCSTGKHTEHRQTSHRPEVEFCTETRQKKKERKEKKAISSVYRIDSVYVYI